MGAEDLSGDICVNIFQIKQHNTHQGNLLNPKNPGSDNIR
ncbi:hypothetical protein CLV51_105258 [Chitinophaga niastensis]|uniref:Uncharacterized protein n=1 Tax=Chitinophaga niastensis TaxID=536980 RepID=A0A2P8HFA4_CHINA|nr:hypothetical protein CLV51_105258 [Chitinophaga niastensis]